VDALTFALGVVSGLTMSFQFGTNWPGYMEKVGNIAGPLLGYEVLTAFFLEATFLGIMLFGIKRVSSKVHTFSALMVAIGTTLSAFWILALNSWMQTPAGFEMRDGVAFPVNWLAIIFNPSFPYRLMHMLLASGLTASFFVAGLSAYRILKGDPKQAPRLALKTGLVLAAILIPLQIFVGDLHGLNTFKHQPQKIAAMEGIWNTERGAPLLLFAIPDQKNQTNHFAVAIPKMASLILTHELDGEIPGLNEFAGEHPPVKPLFFGFRIMVGVGMLMLLVAWRRAAQVAIEGGGGNDFFRLGSHACGLVCHRDRPPAMAGDRPAENRGCSDSTCTCQCGFFINLVFNGVCGADVGLCAHTQGNGSEVGGSRRV
jgi:cytochrome d ubiquinol oxidase subunit I